MAQTFRGTLRTQWAGAIGLAVIFAFVGTAGVARADEGFFDNPKLEIGVMGGGHLFAKDLELGVADDPGLTTPKNAGMFGLRLGLVMHPLLTLEVEGALIPTADRQFDWRAWITAERVQLRFDLPISAADGKLQPFVLGGIGGLSIVSTQGSAYNELKKDTDFVYHFGVGTKYAFTDLVHARVDVRFLEVPNTSKNGVSPDWEFLGGLGLTLGGAPKAPPPPPVPVVTDSDKDGIPDASDKCPVEPGPRENGGCPDKDRDKDGVIDRKDKCPDVAGPPERDGCPVPDQDKDGIADDKDKCPTEAEDKDGFEDEDGCPDPDNDKDGIADVNDKCPNDPETKNGYQDADGCPDNANLDRDGDGIPDDVDKCPDDPEDKDNFEDEDGCPDPDNDKDGILDVNDLCPNDPEDKDGFEDQDGCPDPDNDKDRILDVNDKCPNEPETYNGFEDDDGCPDKGRVIVRKGKLEILDKIYFETDKDEIKPISFPLLDAIAATIKGNPQLQLLEIQGHADERGDDAHNLDLTERRAASVRRALDERNVEPGRLKSHGYGETKPICTQHNEDCWSQNRRVEFIILKRADEAGLTGGEGQ